MLCSSTIPVKPGAAKINNLILLTNHNKNNYLILFKLNLNI
jgi:hypothetical protein